MGVLFRPLVSDRLTAPIWSGLCLGLALFLSGSVSAAPPASVITPQHDDAQLHDLHAVTAENVWSVGDHGVIWASADGGATWRIQSSGVSCPLHSVWFINRREGWIVGGETEPVTHRSRGVVLHTTDGGQHWEQLWPRSPDGDPAAVEDDHRATPAAPPVPDRESVDPETDSEEPPLTGESFRFRTPPVTQSTEGTTEGPRPATLVRLPRLRRVRFFTPQLGLAAGISDGASPGGVYRTDDGGRSWRALTGDLGEEWLGADFANFDTGVLVGLRGETARLVGRKIDRSRRPSIGNRGLYDAALASAQVGWLAGDGGLVLKTTNGGLVWQAPEGSLPDKVRSLFDFRAVACRGEHVWVAGEPGTVIWHSPDGGRSWTPQATGQSLPVTAIHFLDQEHGWAAGSLGLLLQTHDGGATWTIARGSGRRMALWQLNGRGPQARLTLPVELSAELGYRSLVEVVGREDLGQAAQFSRDFPLRVREAVPRAGGSAGVVCWQFPLAAPGLERDLEKLLADWNRRNENRFEEVFTAHLVRQIRMWRPSVLVLDEPADALSRLIRRLSLAAIEQAADPTRCLEHLELGQLEPWQVDRVFERLPAGTRGAVQIERHRLLPNLGISNTTATRQAESLLFTESLAADSRASWGIVYPPPNPDAIGPFRGGFFSGLGIAPGSPARRSMVLVDQGELAEREERARRQRNFVAIADRSMADPAQSARLISDLPATLRALPPAQGADTLAALAQQFVAAGRWELAEITLVELSQRYADEPAGLAAMQQLVQWWSSSELAWRRLRPLGIRQGQLAGTPDAASEAITRALTRLEQQSRGARQTLFDGDDLPAAVETTGTVRLTGNQQPLAVVDATAQQDFRGRLKFWNSQAARMARELQRRAPELAEQPAVQFPMASIYRRQGLYQKSDELFSQPESFHSASMWRRAAQTELWLNTRQAPPEFLAAHCARTIEPPLLDGLLSDLCWQQADEIVLLPAGAAARNSRKTLTFVCCDEEYLYWAGSVPREPTLRRDRPSGKGRQHDGASDDQDRVTLLLDLDRDYHTGYQLTIDQRGETADRCLQDSTWNPSWFAAVDADETHWRFEAAIPWSELTAVVPAPNTAWLLGCVRLIPAVGVASWAHPATPVPRPEVYGLLRFE